MFELWFWQSLFNISTAACEYVIFQEFGYFQKMLKIICQGLADLEFIVKVLTYARQDFQWNCWLMDT